MSDTTALSKRMKKVTIKIDEKQALLIERALDFYSRVGASQFDVIKDHPSFQKYSEELFRPKKKPEVGDRTPQGNILKIQRGKALINGSVKDGRWCEDKKWIDLRDVKLSTNYSRYHENRDAFDLALNSARNILLNEDRMSLNGSWGIHNENVDDSCRAAYDILQVMRHERWKLDEDRSFMTVDSSVHFTSNSFSRDINVKIG